MPFISLPQRGSEQQIRKRCLFLPREDCRENPEMALSVERTFRLWRAAQDKEWICLSLSAVKSWTSWDQKLIHGGTWCISSSCEMTSWRKGQEGTWGVTWEVTKMGKKIQRRRKKGKGYKERNREMLLAETFQMAVTEPNLDLWNLQKGMKGKAGWVKCDPRGYRAGRSQPSAFQVRDLSKDSPGAT